MPLTREFNETVQARLRSDRNYRKDHRYALPSSVRTTPACLAFVGSTGLVSRVGQAGGTWEFGMGVFLYVIFGIGTHLIASAPHSIVTVFDFTNCYAAPPVALPCERVAYRAGALNAALNGWCGLLLIAVAAWLVWDLSSAAAPRPITDDFLR